MQSPFLYAEVIVCRTDQNQYTHYVPLDKGRCPRGAEGVITITATYRKATDPRRNDEKTLLRQKLTFPDDFHG